MTKAVIATNKENTMNICPICECDEYEIDCEDYETACVVCMSCGYTYTINKEERVTMPEDVIELRIKQLKDWLDSGYMTYEQLLTILGVSDGNEETYMYS